jgi:RimJ/RimL family protein N-acetyltransferase
VAQLPDVLSAPPVELRRWDVSHVDALMRALDASRDELTRWMPWATPWPSREDEHAAMERGVADFDRDHEYAYNMFEGDELVGGAALLRVPDDDSWQIGYWVRTDCTRRGYATTAARTLTSAAFDLLGLDSVLLRMDQANVASAAVPPKLGYVLTAETGRPKLAPGHVGRGFVWTMTRDRWPRTGS